MLPNVILSYAQTITTSEIIIRYYGDFVVKCITDTF